MNRPLLPVLAPSVPNMARFYDAMLSGKDNYAADRVLARKVAMLAPAVHGLFRQNRIFLRRAVLRMADRGITQFLDLGCGLPVAENTHEIAQSRGPGARVVYVDCDPAVVAHGSARLVDNDRTAVVDADIRDADEVLRAAEVFGSLDLTRPVGILLTSVLPHIEDSDDPHGVVRSYTDRLPSGSMVAISHFHAPEYGEPLAEQARGAERVLLAELGSGWFRSRAAIGGVLRRPTL